jgi:DnaJ-like protein
VKGREKNFCKTMNYYEELGIAGNATTAEVREAYKLAARLLHPDMQQDRRLKDLAECQMRRLSGVLAMLVNPRERARYDAGLANEARPEQFPLPAAEGGSKFWQTAARHWFWVLLGSMIVGMGVWYGLARGTDVPPRIAAERNARAATGPLADRPEPALVKSRRVKTAETTRRRGARPAAPLGNTAGEPPEPIVRTTAVTPAPRAEVPAVEQTPAPVKRDPPPADAAPSGDAPRFAGQWLYAADAAGEDPVGTYPAKYVEFRLHEDRGNLAGDYRAVHTRVDKAISSEVVFHVRGELPPGETGMLDWESNAGAKGELELTLQAPNRLLVKWWTTQFGRLEVLSSGMAVLMRLKNP